MFKDPRKAVAVLGAAGAGLLMGPLSLGIRNPNTVMGSWFWSLSSTSPISTGSTASPLSQIRANARAWQNQAQTQVQASVQVQAQQEAGAKAQAEVEARALKAVAEVSEAMGWEEPPRVYLKSQRKKDPSLSSVYSTGAKRWLPKLFVGPPSLVLERSELPLWFPAKAATSVTPNSDGNDSDKLENPLPAKAVKFAVARALVDLEIPSSILTTDAATQQLSRVSFATAASAVVATVAGVPPPAIAALCLLTPWVNLRRRIRYTDSKVDVEAAKIAGESSARAYFDWMMAHHSTTLTYDGAENITTKAVPEASWCPWESPGTRVFTPAARLMTLEAAWNPEGDD